MSVAVLFGLFFFLVIIGAPIAICLGAATFTTMMLFTPISPIEISAMIFEKIEHYSLMAIPMFILAGNLLSKGSAAQRIIEFAKSIVGHLPGGLPISAIFASIIFAAVSGSSPATVVAIGSIMFGAIMQAGYPKKYAVGTIATAGSLGILIPQKLPLIKMSDEPVEKTGMDVGDLVPISGLCCTISSLYLEWPQCVGCAGKGVCICFEGEGMVCKIPGDDEDEKTICIFSRTNVRCIQPNTCCKSTSQVWCFDNRCALPADEEVPCIFTGLPGCICVAFSVANFGCCQAIKDLKGYTPPTSA